MLNATEFQRYFGRAHLDSLCLRFAMVNGLLDSAAQGQPLNSLSRQTGNDPHIARRVLLRLAALGIVSISSDELVAVTPLGMHCLSDHVRKWLLFQTEPYVYLRLFRRLFGEFPDMDEEIFDYLGKNGSELQCFHQSMEGTARITAAEMFRHGILRNVAQTVTDIGGGNGAFCIELARMLPRSKLICFERADVRKLHEELTESTTTSGKHGRPRISYLYGDFFVDELPRSDFFVLSTVLHNWPNDKAITLLGNVRRSSGGATTLLIIEKLLPIDGAQEAPEQAEDITATDVRMVAVCSGKERDLGEYSRILSDAGLALQSVVPLAFPLHCLVVRLTDK